MSSLLSGDFLVYDSEIRIIQLSQERDREREPLKFYFDYFLNISQSGIVKVVISWCNCRELGHILILSGEARED